jgi:hypothetical protein
MQVIYVFKNSVLKSLCPSSVVGMFSDLNPFSLRGLNCH